MARARNPWLKDRCSFAKPVLDVTARDNYRAIPARPVGAPAEAQSGQQLRIRGKGVAAHGQTPAGDLYLRLMVRVPKEKLGDDVVEKIDEAYGEDVRKDLRL